MNYNQRLVETCPCLFHRQLRERRASMTLNPDPLTVIPDEPEPGHDWEPSPRRDLALIIGAAAVLAIVALLLVGGTRV
jgi:hypothetical protein